MITKRAFIRENPLLILSYSVKSNFANKCINSRRHNTINIISPYTYKPKPYGSYWRLDFQLDDSWHERSIRDTKRSASTAFSTIRGHRLHIVRADQRFSTRHGPPNIPNFPRFISGFPLLHSFIINSYISIKPNRQFLINPGVRFVDVTSYAK